MRFGKVFEVKSQVRSGLSLKSRRWPNKGSKIKCQKFCEKFNFSVALAWERPAGDGAARPAPRLAQNRQNSQKSGKTFDAQTAQAAPLRHTDPRNLIPQGTH